MDSVVMSMLVFGLLLVIGTQSGSALRCYVCNSGKDYEGKECEDSTLDEKFLFDCDIKYPQSTQNFTLCRKMDQDVEGDTRIVRDCAIAGEDRCITRTGTRLIKIDYCECKGDACNSANGVFNTVVKFTIVFSTLFSFLIYKS